MYFSSPTVLLKIWVNFIDYLFVNDPSDFCELKIRNCWPPLTRHETKHLNHI